MHDALWAGEGNLSQVGRSNGDIVASVFLDHEPAPRIPKQTILLVEDEAFVRDVLCSAGYGVVAAANAAQAVAAFCSQARQVQLLLTDVVLPDRRGDALAGELEAARGNLRVIFMSGYPENVVAQERFRRPGWLYLAKPFTASCLLEEVEKALRGEVGP